MSSKTNCPNCGAPITGSVCEYCGTRHDTGIAFQFDDPPPYISAAMWLPFLSRSVQQCNCEELEQIRERNAREAVNVFADRNVATAAFQRCSAEHVILALRPWPVSEKGG